MLTVTASSTANFHRKKVNGINAENVHCVQYMHYTCIISWPRESSVLAIMMLRCPVTVITNKIKHTLRTLFTKRYSVKE